ncbi:Exonuclease VII small subunit [Gloeothece citriformis PCC 7424]|uniref:Exodeoxyribonuclease 7 small subunit n=1 Tax=Gloeothece citriformis (strain PCC 7424) TaxID=65393 RepID=B7KAR5_GLOC7|nr:exodeoxyribonuclease VII small subunit [Gloeothece citriformis]ACK68737.1 Exonuclease VII small subunit [Gloeothece citriformis PCC 7424]
MPSRSKRPKNWNYEETVAEVEEIIQQIEYGSLPLEEVFKQFEVAVERLQKCEEFLNQGKERMSLLIETLEEDVEF